MSENFERWKELAALCVREQDPVRLTVLVSEMNAALAKKFPYGDPPVREALLRPEKGIADPQHDYDG